MEIEYDSAKDENNVRKHGVSLADAGLIDWSSALIRRDLRRDYEEQRYQAFGMLNGRLYLVVFTPRNGAMRVISMRKANKREERKYESQNL
ncbi:BrnT family toxin [Noviherbaspirillum pedocola]|jgi:uncharacterized DUF497 family protein|uniref:BrnT family toxin n=1 Tax=Noviherbaspirillum pedocola TaxID=2801341 RepID=A0A934W8W3_9BURK|nr:BrnT family toxin [Noviherbaspirillum pedocola]MBK4739137.1 BrnT family toxin [Noviherbaspirillum pedocola]